MFNKVFLVGNLGQDPKLKSFDSGNSVCSLSLATSEKWKDKDDEWQETTQWHRIQAWGKLGESLSKYLQKGDKVIVEGKITYRTYPDKETGEEKSITEIIASSVKRTQKANSDQSNSYTPQENKDPWDQ